LFHGHITNSLFSPAGSGNSGITRSQLSGQVRGGDLSGPRRQRARSLVERYRQAGHRAVAPGQVHGAAASAVPGEADDVIVALSLVTDRQVIVSDGGRSA
jgi:hypothetical protein